VIYPWPNCFSLRGHRLIVADVIYSTAFTGRGYSRIGRGGLTNAGGALEPADFALMEIDAILFGSGSLLVSIEGLGRTQNAFRGVRVPGVAGGAELLTADASFFNNAGAPNYDVTHWEWHALSGAIVDGDVEFT
jgi:hypothetical protein